MNHWLVKQEPDSYSWNDFLKEGGTVWSGVRNYQARNNLRAMKKGDPVLFYHSGEEKQIVGLAKVSKEAWPDPTAEEGDWVCVELKPVKTLNQPVPLSVIKADTVFKDMLLLRNSRLSVSPVGEPQFARILALGKTEARGAAK